MKVLFCLFAAMVLVQVTSALPSKTANLEELNEKFGLAQELRDMMRQPYMPSTHDNQDAMEQEDTEVLRDLGISEDEADSLGLTRKDIRKLGEFEQQVVDLISKLDQDERRAIQKFALANPKASPKASAQFWCTVIGVLIQAFGGVVSALG